MNGKYLYEVFKYCEEKEIPDLIIALAKYEAEHPIPEGNSYSEICKFIGVNYDALVNAYGKDDELIFVKTVEKLVKEA